MRSKYILEILVDDYNTKLIVTTSNEKAIIHIDYNNRMKVEIESLEPEPLKEKKVND